VRPRTEEAKVSKVIFDISMSLDGFVTASGVRPGEPMGDGGQKLHEWAHGDDEKGNEVLAESQGAFGASIAGRRSYDTSLPWWDADGPEGSVRTPTFIVSHSEPDEVPEGSVYTFVGSLEEAVEKASEMAGNRSGPALWTRFACASSLCSSEPAPACSGTQAVSGSVWRPSRWSRRRRRHTSVSASSGE
jgi:dihydrofolate reductase